MAIIKTVENELFLIQQHDDKIDRYTARCKTCNTLGWITGKTKMGDDGIIYYSMNILCPVCKQKDVVNVKSDTNPSEPEEEK